MKTSPPFASSDRLRISVIIGLIVAVAIAVLSATGLETYLNQERRLVSAGHQIVTALEAYRANSPGSAKELPRALEDLLHDPRNARRQRLSHYVACRPHDAKARLGRDQKPSGANHGRA